jgi:hypothetical protein
VLRLSPTLAGQRDDDRVGNAPIDERLQERRLSGAGRTEYSNSRTPADRQQSVDHANSRPQRLADCGALVGSWRTQFQGDAAAA